MCCNKGNRNFRVKIHYRYGYVMYENFHKLYQTFVILWHRTSSILKGYELSTRKFICYTKKKQKNKKQRFSDHISQCRRAGDAKISDYVFLLVSDISYLNVKYVKETGFTPLEFMCSASESFEGHDFLILSSMGKLARSFSFVGSFI